MEGGTYDQLIIELRGERVNFLTLIYANAMLVKHLKEEDCKECLHSNTFTLKSASMNAEDDIFLNANLIKMELELFSEKRLIVYPEFKDEPIINKLFNLNAIFLRAKILNNYFEILKDWYQKYDVKEWGKLHGYAWLQMLYILRNMASHGKSSSKKIKFLKKSKNNRWLAQSYPEVVQWKNIKIREYQSQGEVLFTDKDVLDLMDEALTFLESQREFFK